jgi:hypothetical protein
MGIKGMVARRVVPILLDVISRVPLSSSNRSRMPARPTRAPEKPSPKRCNKSIGPTVLSASPSSSDDAFKAVDDYRESVRQCALGNRAACD